MKYQVCRSSRKLKPLMNGAQPGSISVADLAVAIVDELETPRHVQKRFTVAN